MQSIEVKNKDSTDVLRPFSTSENKISHLCCSSPSKFNDFVMIFHLQAEVCNALEIQTLERSLSVFQKRHPLLRAGIKQNAGFVLSKNPIPYRVEDYEVSPKKIDYSEEFKDLPFCCQGPLVSVKLYRPSNGVGIQHLILKVL